MDFHSTALLVHHPASTHGMAASPALMCGPMMAGRRRVADVCVCTPGQQINDPEDAAPFRAIRHHLAL